MRRSSERLTIAGALLLAVVAASPVAAASPANPARPPNVLLVVADDMGVDMLRCYGKGRDTPNTPVIDQLAANGLLFRNAWANPVCSPTRATLLTGRYGFRTGVQHVVTSTQYALPLDELTLPEALDLMPAQNYCHALIGKWHLGNDSNGGDAGPNLAGFSHYAGSFGGFVGPHPAMYFKWFKTTNGSTSFCNVYNSSATVDDALGYIASRTGPWFVMVSFCAPHEPFHAPPVYLHNQQLPGTPPSVTPRPYYKAAIEAMDTELGRLLTGLGHALLDTTVIFMADNGTPPQIPIAPFTSTHAKGSLYEGGVNVPLIVYGSHVTAPGRECSALVNSTDIFATVTDLAGVTSALPPGVRDSVSLVPYLLDPAAPALRDLVFAEHHRSVRGVQIDAYAVRDATHKLIRSEQNRALKSLELFDLTSDPFERTNLLKVHQPAPQVIEKYRALSDRMKDLLSAWKF